MTKSKFRVIRESQISRSPNGSLEIIGIGGEHASAVYALAEADARNLLSWTDPDWIVQGNPDELAKADVNDEHVFDALLQLGLTEHEAYEVMA